MKIQKIIETSTYQRVIEYNIETERMRNLPHTFGNFRDEDEFHSAFFDQNHPNHSEAYEILEHVLKPDAIYENQQVSSNEYWASGNDLKITEGEPVNTPQNSQQKPVLPYDGRYAGKNNHLNHLSEDEIRG